MLRPYKVQLDAIKAAITKGNGGIVMPTGTGKSITMALLINALQVRTLVVCPTLELKNQLSETFMELFGSLENIAVYNIDSPSLKTATDYDLIIIDECHKSAARTYQNLNKNQWKNIYHRYFFTATFFRNLDHEHLLFEAICGQSIYRLTNKQAVEQNIIAPVEAYYLELPISAVEGYTYKEVYNELIIDNPHRNSIIAALINDLRDADKYTLILVKEIRHGKILSELTGAPFANGQDEESRAHLAMFKTGKIKTLIATEGIAGTGVDTKPCEFLLYAGLGKAKSAFMQAIGRTVRRYPGKESAKVILFKDKSHKFTLSHFNAQKKILVDEYGLPVVKLD